MTDYEILCKAREIIGEFGCEVGGEIVPAFSQLVKDLTWFMEEVGFEER